MSFCATTVNLNSELRKYLKDHPWVSLAKESRYVHGHGTTWDLKIYIPNQEFAKLYTFAQAKKSIWFSWLELGEYLKYPLGYEDIVGLHRLLKCHTNEEY